MEKESGSTFVATLLYCIWQFRNSSIFEGKQNLTEAIGKFNYIFKDFCFSSDHSSHSDSPSMDESIQLWNLPPENWIQVNVDASHNGSQASIAMVVRDKGGNLLYLPSKSVYYESSHTAEIKALEWDSAYAEDCGWENVMWIFDDK